MRLALLAPLFLAACAAAPLQEAPGNLGPVTGAVGETVRIQDLRLTPLEIVEDSRCPADVQCVWAGRLRVRVAIQAPAFSQTEVLELGQGIALEDARLLVLTEAMPAPRQRGAPNTAAYRLTFAVGPGD